MWQWKLGSRKQNEQRGGNAKIVVKETTDRKRENEMRRTGARQGKKKNNAFTTMNQGNKPRDSLEKRPSCKDPPATAPKDSAQLLVHK